VAGCASSTTTTTTTSTTLPAECCEAARITTRSTGRCRGNCSTTTSTRCLADADCPSGETCTGRTSCLDAAGCPSTDCVSDGTLKVSTLPPFTFPLGVQTTVDAGPPDSLCKHDAIVPPGGFTVPNFFIAGLNYCSAVTPTHCESGGADGNGTLWDGHAPPQTVLADVEHSGDTSDGTCDTATNCSTLPGTCTEDASWGCSVTSPDCSAPRRCSADHSFTGRACTTATGCRTCNAGSRVGEHCTVDNNTNLSNGCPGATCPGCCVSVQTCDTLASKGTCDTSQPGAGTNTTGRIVTTRSGPGVPGVNVVLGIPVESLTWSEAAQRFCHLSGEPCPTPTPVPDPCTEANPADFCDQTAACATGFDESAGDIFVTGFTFILTPTSGVATARFADQNANGCFRSGSGPNGPVTLSGRPAPGPCCEVGQATTVAAAGVAFTGGGPLFDILFSSTIPTQVTSCDAYTPGGACTLTTDTCLGP